MDVAQITSIVADTWKVYQSYCAGGPKWPENFSTGSMAMFFKLNEKWGLKLYWNQSWAINAMMRHLYLLDQNLAPEMGTELLAIKLGDDVAYGYLNEMCDEARESNTRYEDYKVMEQEYLEAGLKDLLCDVSDRGLNWGYRRSDRKPVIYDFLTWQAPEWVDK